MKSMAGKKLETRLETRAGLSYLRLPTSVSQNKGLK